MESCVLAAAEVMFNLCQTASSTPAALPIHIVISLSKVFKTQACKILILELLGARCQDRNAENWWKTHLCVTPTCSVHTMMTKLSRNFYKNFWISQQNRQCIKKKLFMIRVVRHRNGLLRDVVDASSLKVFKVSLDQALSNLSICFLSF